MRTVPTRALLRLLMPALALGVVLIAPSGASAAAHLEDTWCTSSSACVAVGASDNDEGEAASSNVHVKRWNGSAWTAEEVDPPEAAVTSVLDGISCASASACAAVGSYADEEAEATLALAMRWDGTDWDIDELPKPAGAIATKLAEVACTSASACIAIGVYTDGSEVRKSLAMRWDGSAWSLLSVPIPSGAGLSELEGISCTASNDCVAVGSFVNSAEVTKTLAVSWNGSSWSIASTPEPSGSELNQLYDVSCRPSDACTAVGTYFDSTGDQKTLALRRNTSKVWSIQTTPNKANALSRTLTSVSCSSTTSCVSMGIVEQGRKEIPIAIGWNGSSWSEQSIDTESLGAAVVKPEGVFCTSSTSCDAVGAVSYGRSAAPRNLAFHFNGTSWSVSEAGGYERKWIDVDVMEHTSDLASVSCPVSLRCFAVGRALDDDGVRRNQVAEWEAESWGAASGPEPEGAKSSELVGITCTSAINCFAVGAYADSEDVQRLLMARWDGSSWMLESLSSPSGAKAAALMAVDCFSAGACTAVGSYVDSEDVQRSLAMSYNGTSWSLQSVTLPSGAVGAVLSSVSCTSTTSCMAVGTKFDSFGHETGFAAKREGSTWSHATPPGLEGEAPYLLRGVSCTSSSHCIGVGYFEDFGGDPHNLALDWDGTTWEEMDDVPSTDTVGLAGVSCASATSCIAVGGRSSNSTQPPQILGFDGTDWELEPPAQYPQGTAGHTLTGVSCISAGECHATGSASYGGLAPQNAALALNDGQWVSADATAPGAGLRGVSCLSAGSCIAVGDSLGEPTGDPATAWVLGEEQWELSDTSSAEGAFLNEVSCTETDECTAIGRKGKWPFQPFAERFDGEGWSTQSMPVPSGRSSQLESASCSSASWCAAAGFSWPTAGAGAAAALIETWSGSAWQVASLSLPGGATSAFLHDISCASSTACVAVGSYTDSGGVHHGLVQRWNGSSWSASSISSPSGQSYRLKGVDCTATSACTAVGTTTSTADGEMAAIAMRWNGSSWAAETVPIPEDVTVTKLNDVDCYSSAECVAAGSFTDAQGSDPFIVSRASGTWTQEIAPEATAEGNTSLESISCPSAADCLAVGISQGIGRPGRPFMVQTEGEKSWEKTEPVKAPSEPPPSLTAQQREDAMTILEEDPAVQAALGAAEYDFQIGPWTETSEAGAETLVGAYVELTLEEGEYWAERTWPTASYDLGSNGYEDGQYAQSDLDAAAEEIEMMTVCLDLTFDGSANVTDGEAIEVLPLTLESGNIDIDEADTEYDQQVAGY